MRSTRLRLDGVSVGPDHIGANDVSYADVFVVVRDDHALPAPSDWEVTLRTGSDHAIAPGQYELRLDAADGTVLRGAAVLRFTDGRRHLFRGDGDLDGFVDEGMIEGS